MIVIVIAHPNPTGPGDLSPSLVTVPCLFYGAVGHEGPVVDVSTIYAQTYADPARQFGLFISSPAVSAVQLALFYPVFMPDGLRVENAPSVHAAIALFKPV